MRTWYYYWCSSSQCQVQRDSHPSTYLLTAQEELSLQGKASCSEVLEGDFKRDYNRLITSSLSSAHKLLLFDERESQRSHGDVEEYEESHRMNKIIQGQGGKQYKCF